MKDHPFVVFIITLVGTWFLLGWVLPAIRVKLYQRKGIGKEEAEDRAERMLLSEFILYLVIGISFFCWFLYLLS